MAAPKRRNIGAEILEGLRQLKRGEHGGVSVRTLQEWEQGRRAPSGAARILLMIAARNPRALIEVA